MFLSYHSVMARPTTITDEQILEAARALFLDKGLAASTAEIAKAAGVSEGTIFNRFGTKAGLFEAAMGLGEQLPEMLKLAELAGRNTVEENLTSFICRFIEVMREVMPRLHLALTHPSMKAEELLRRHPDPPPLRGLRAIMGYLDAEQRAGRLGNHDPEVAARVFLGAIQSYVFFETMGLNERMPLPPATFARGLVHTILHGIAPREIAPPHDAVAEHDELSRRDPGERGAGAGTTTSSTKD